MTTSTPQQPHSPDAPPSPLQSATPPPSYRHALDQDWAISMLMEMQKTLGKMETAVEATARDVGELKAKASRVDKILFAAGAILAIVVTVSAWLLNAAKDAAMTAYKASLDTNAAAAAAAAARAAEPPKPPASPRK